jgi:hypothetical protein
VRSCAHWLSWKCGIGLVAARDKVRVERVVREYRECERREELCKDETRHGSRRAVYRWDDDGSLVIEARLPPEQGALVVEALQVAESELREAQWQREGDSAESSTTTWGQRQADALVRCAEAYLAGDGATLPPGERHQVQVQVDAEALADPEGQGDCAIQDGPAIPPETARRLTCDGSLVALLNDGDGTPIPESPAAPPPAQVELPHPIDARTAIPGWMGEPLDLTYCLTALFQRRDSAESLH